MSSTTSEAWVNHFKTGREEGDFTSDKELSGDVADRIQSWLTALFQSEHLNVLLGSGLTHAVLGMCGERAAGMGSLDFEKAPDFSESVIGHAKKHAEKCGRGAANLEDQIKSLNELIAGFEVGGWEGYDALIDCLNGNLLKFYNSLIETEQKLKTKLSEESGIRALNFLQSLLLSFASRSASRDRVHVFTTNYDRLIELGCDYAGIRIIDRFLGYLEPVFRATRLDIDYHFNPPGIKAEPRYVEGVIRYSKLHGSLDWRWEGKKVIRRDVRFGVAGVPLANPRESLMIYPNSVKDYETSGFPYVELFRDLACAACRPNSVLATYGYSFGDDHINRVIEDMLTLPSSHLVIIAYSDEGDRIRKFYEKVGRPNQFTLLIGSKIANLETLVKQILPKPAIDLISAREAKVIGLKQQLDKPAAPSPQIVDLEEDFS